MCSETQLSWCFYLSEGEKEDAGKFLPDKHGRPEAEGTQVQATMMTLEKTKHCQRLNYLQGRLNCRK